MQVIKLIVGHHLMMLNYEFGDLRKIMVEIMEVKINRVDPGGRSYQPYWKKL